MALPALPRASGFQKKGLSKETLGVMHVWSMQEYSSEVMQETFIGIIR
jgi:hypothetical protein